MFFRQLLLKTLLTVACAVFIPVSTAWAADFVQVTVDKLNVRNGPSLQDTILTTLPKQTVLTVMQKQNDWVQVKLSDGRTGWVAGWYVTPVANAPAASSSTAPTSTASAASAIQVESKTDGLNVRTGPGTNHSIIQTIDPGTRYPVVQKQGDWYQIQLPSDNKGWVAGWLVKEHAASGGGTHSPAASDSPAANQPATPAASPQSQANAGKTGSVQGASMTLNSSPYIYPVPDAGTPAIGQLHPGQTITVLARQGAWIQFPYNGINAWISVGEPENSASPATDVTQGGQAQTPTAAGDAQNATQTITLTVKTDGLNLRSEGNTSSAILGTLPLNTQLTVLKQQGEWYQVKTPDGKIGWVAGWLVSVNYPTPEGPYVTILNQDTNVRKGPGTEYEIIRRLNAGEKHPILGTEGDWFQIRLSDGTAGYVAGWLVSPVGAPAVIKNTELTGKVIVVDPGHGGSDNGATGSSFATLEKNVNLQVALMLRNKLESAGAKVIMTRADDRKLTLQQRVDIAVQNNADIFVSIHHNTHPNPETNGTIVFYYSEGNSSKLASLVQNGIVHTANYKDLQARFGDYYVLRENPVPAILAEVGFLSNYSEEIRLRSERQQELAAEGIFKGIVQYFAMLNNQGG